MRQKSSKGCPQNFFFSSEHTWNSPLTLIWPWRRESLRVFGGFAYGV